MNDKQLIQLAKEARELSYSPYSKFKVGAAVLTKDGKIFKGTNIENSSYGLSICAERTAMFNAYINGYKKDDIVAISCIGDTEDAISPCGSCRQVMSELLNKDAKVVLGNLKGKIEIHTVEELLPFAFSSKDL